MILRGKDNFDRIFSGAKPIYGKHVDLRYIWLEDPSDGFKMAFIAGKRTGKASRRNRAKRLMREAYRLHRHTLEKIVTDSGRGFHGALIAKQPDSPYKAVELDIINLLGRVDINPNQVIANTGR